MASLSYRRWRSRFLVSFWNELSSRYIRNPALSGQHLEASFAIGAGADEDPELLFTKESFIDDQRAGGATEGRRAVLHGKLVVVPTLDAFRKYGFARDIRERGDWLVRAWRVADVRRAVVEPAQLIASFHLVVFPDIKKYEFHYAVLHASPILPSLEDSKVQDLQEFCGGDLERAKMFAGRFFAQNSETHEAVVVADGNGGSDTPGIGSEISPSLLAVFDPCGGTCLGWTARNAIMLAAAEGMSTLQHQFVLLGDSPGETLWPDVREPPDGEVEEVPPKDGPSELLAARRCHVVVLRSVDFPAENLVITPGLQLRRAVERLRLRFTGMEVNLGSGKPRPNIARLKNVLSPEAACEGLADLNVNLMKWRIQPLLNPRLLNVAALIVGAGTLGCGVARGLLAWSVKRITFVDSGRVSHASPVRQSLYQFYDACACDGEGAFKADAAVEAICRIRPGVTARGEVLRIPMPGHRASDADVSAVSAAVKRFDALVCEHDIVFLGTDSREARWLPSVAACARGKPLINVAIGFDAYVVQRQRLRTPGAASLGCYFCPDVVAPNDSLTDRALDQQCTVSRPGVAAIAAAHAVELMVSTLHHPLGFAAGAEDYSPLGQCYHQLRGAVATPECSILSGASSQRCVCCSEAVLNAYEKDPAELVLRAAQEPSTLESLAGCDQMHGDLGSLLADTGDASKPPAASDGDCDDDGFVLI